MIRDIVVKNRSYRRFDETHRINRQDLLDLVEMSTLTPSARNQQALKFMLVHEEPDCALVFDQLSWAGYLKDWPGPKKGERPTGYIIVLGDKNLGSDFDTDTGIVAQTILLAAVEKGLGGCMIVSVRRQVLGKQLELPDHLDIRMVIALGKDRKSVV